MIMLDTHVVAWLYGGQLECIPESVRNLLDSQAASISPMVLLELQYLYEIKRVTVPAAQVMESLSTQIGLKQADTPFPAVVSAALGITWTRDPFDRLIVAQALAENAPLVTADETIRKHLPLATWD